jgi:hypothetical protein
MCPGRSAARSGALQNRDRTKAVAFVTVPALRSSAKGALHRVRHTGDAYHPHFSFSPITRTSPSGICL